MVMRRNLLTARSQINVGHHSAVDRSGRALTCTHDHKNLISNIQFEISTRLRALLFLLGDFAHHHSQVARDAIQSDGHTLRPGVDEKHNLAN